MQKRWFARVSIGVGVLVAWGAAACSGDPGPAGGGAPVSSGKPGRGSAACQKWQGAICDWSSKCGTAPRSVCDQQAKGVICKSDELATSCATQLATAACTAPPAGCDSVDLADAAAAVALCDTYLGSACDALIRCGVESDKDACHMKLMSSQNCSKVVGVGLGYETCLDDLAHAACNELLPVSCNGVFFETR